MLMNQQKYCFFAHVAYVVQQTCIGYTIWQKAKKKKLTRINGIFLSTVMATSATFEGSLGINDTFEAFDCIHF